MVEHNFTEDILNILRVLSSQEGCTQRDLSHRLGFSLGKTNYLLKSLAQKGLVEIGNLARFDNKIKKIKYLLTSQGLDTKLKLTCHFLKIKEQEYLRLKAEARELMVK